MCQNFYGAYDSIGINVVSFGDFLSLSNPNKNVAQILQGNFFWEK
jgi:hypothetical protein